LSVHLYCTLSLHDALPISVFDPDGNKYEFEPASEYVSDLRSTPVEINEDEYELLDGTVIQWYEETDLYNQGVDLHNAHMDWIDVDRKSTRLNSSHVSISYA